jgi:hypothetical protein
VWYQSDLALAALLDVCDVLFAEDLEEAFYLSAFAGCTGVLLLFRETWGGASPSFLAHQIGSTPG